MLKVLSRSHTEMKTYYILHIIYVRNGSIDICVFIIIFERSQTNTHINIYWRITNASLPNSERAAKEWNHRLVFASYIRSYVHSVLWIFFDFFFLLLLMRWFADERPRAKAKAEIEWMGAPTKEEKKIKEATFAWNREQKNMKRKKTHIIKWYVMRLSHMVSEKLIVFLLLKQRSTYTY